LTTQAELVQLMIGHELRVRAALPPLRGAASPIVIAVERAAEKAAITLQGGEIVGLAGLVGSGRTRLARAIAGLEPGGRVSVRVDGTAFPLRSPADAVRLGIVYLTEDRKR